MSSPSSSCLVLSCLVLPSALCSPPLLRFLRPSPDGGLSPSNVLHALRLFVVSAHRLPRESFGPHRSLNRIPLALLGLKTNIVEAVIRSGCIRQPFN